MLRSVRATGHHLSTWPSSTVNYKFASPIDAQQADAAAATMTRRLVKFGHPGSSATVNSDGTGFAIKVAGVTSASEANAIVAKLDVPGSVYYRRCSPVRCLQRPEKTPSSQTATQLGVSAGTDLSSVKGYDTPTSAASSVRPTQAAVIADMEYGTTNVIVRWQVGPSQLDGTSTENTKVTKLNGAPVERGTGTATLCRHAPPATPPHPTAKTVTIFERVVSRTHAPRSRRRGTPADSIRR